MATVFWDGKGAILLDCLPKGSRTTGEYYANLPVQLRIAICEKKCGKLSKVVFVHQDNARVHNCKILTHCRLNEIPHTIYWKILILILGMSGCVI